MIEARKGRVHVRVLGEIAVAREGVLVSLPSSRKARALLGYLALTARPHRRSRLCELFWDLPDDPRAALRWALSKLRAALGPHGRETIQADRERVGVRAERVSTDLADLRGVVPPDLPFIPPAKLREAAEALSHPVLDGLEGAGTNAFCAWLAAEREDTALMRRNVLRRLATHPDLEPAEQLAWAHRWAEVAPYDAAAMRCIVDRLRADGHVAKAAAQAEAFARILHDVGLDATALEAVGVGVERASVERRALRQQTIGFARASDGARIAYATVGDGPPLVKAANWLNHLELDWGSPIWGRTFGAAAVGRTFVRYDERGNGLSDWDVADISFEAFVRDLECVVDALGLSRFPLLGMSQGCAVSIAYAARHPERVSALVLVSGYATGWRIGRLAHRRERGGA